MVAVNLSIGQIFPLGDYVLTQCMQTIDNSYEIMMGPEGDKWLATNPTILNMLSFCKHMTSNAT